MTKEDMASGPQGFEGSFSLQFGFVSAIHTRLAKSAQGQIFEHLHGVRLLSSWSLGCRSCGMPTMPEGSSQFDTDALQAKAWEALRCTSTSFLSA